MAGETWQGVAERSKNKLQSGIGLAGGQGGAGALAGAVVGVRQGLAEG